MLNKGIRIHAAMAILALGGAGMSSASTAALLIASVGAFPLERALMKVLIVA